MWHEEAEEPEDNVLALTLSFLTAARSNDTPVPLQQGQSMSHCSHCPLNVASHGFARSRRCDSGYLATCPTLKA